MDIILTWSCYLVTLFFVSSYAAKALIWVKDKPARIEPHSQKTKPSIFFIAAGDILFFRRLLSVNGLLWIGEFTFHVSFVLVMLRHLRYVLDPAPKWVGAIQTAGIIAGYILPLALFYILAVKFVIERKRYCSSYNSFLLITLLVLSISGLLMKTVYRPDVAGIKEFAVGMVSFRPAALPEGVLFPLHFFNAMLLFAYLPAHAFSAPFTITDAKRREDELKWVVHEK